MPKITNLLTIAASRALWADAVGEGCVKGTAGVRFRTSPPNENGPWDNEVPRAVSCLWDVTVHVGS